MSTTRTKIPGVNVSFFTTWSVPRDTGEDPENTEFKDRWRGLTFYFDLSYEGNPSGIAELASKVSINWVNHANPLDRKHNTLDERADWHHNTTPLTAWMKAHAYRLARGWQTKKLASWFAEHPDLTRDFGFHGKEGDLGRVTASPPSQSRLWEIWNEEFDTAVREACRVLSRQLFLTAYEHRLPLPDPAFVPEDRNINSDRSKRRFIVDKTKEVWKQAKPFVTNCFSLKRGQNAQIHENAFWEGHAYTGMRNDMYAQDGADTFYADSSRDRTPSGSNHRYQIQKLDVDEIRPMLRKTTKALVKRARRRDELTGRLWAAIDITKGAPWTGDIEWTDDDHPEDPYLLGYKENENKKADYYFQWATIQIVGMDIPLVLDARPVKRGDPRADIVDDLLENALDVIGDIELVMMDREFDGGSVKDVCDKHGVYYLNPSRKHTSDRATCTRLRNAGQKVRVRQEVDVEGPARKRIFLPARNTDVFEPTEDGNEDEEDVESEESKSKTRREMETEFKEITVDTDDEDSRMFDELLGEIAEEERVLPGSDEDADAYALFETNHPALETDAESRERLLAKVRGFIQRYSHRWGIENGYKQIKQFRVRTTSKDHQYRFFNFAFACVLYNVWRLVDLLVKLSIEDAPGYEPTISADKFLTVAKMHFGLDPPD